MSKIFSEVITHRLNINPNIKPVRQKKRSFIPERQRVIDEEVDKLLAASFIKEATYSDWLVNVVMVRKANEKWRICIDYIDLNEACSKDSFPLSKIDQLVDVTSDHRLLSFMDTFIGYNQIWMATEDEEYTAFVTDKGIYCYKVIPFDLKNIGITYKRLVNKIFKAQIGWNIEIYVDDMLVKSLQTSDYIQDLEEAFGMLRRYRMKLNPIKCAFEVTSEKFFEFFISQWEIDANPEKIKTIINMKYPSSKKEIQQLNGRIVALSRFISRSIKRCLPFFKILWQTKDFLWSDECWQSFEDLKKILGFFTFAYKTEGRRDIVSLLGNFSRSG